MGYTNDPANSVIDRLRLKTGDIDPYEEGLTDEVYEYVYLKQGLNENRAALEALRMLVVKYAHYCTERSGQYLIEAEEKYQNFKDLLDRAIRDPGYGFLPDLPDNGLPPVVDPDDPSSSGGYAGGLTVRERYGENRSSNPLRLGESYGRFILK